MRYILKVFFICFLFLFYLSCNNIFYIGGQIDTAIHDNSLKKDIFKSHKLMINDTFSIEGSLISTTPPNMSSIFMNNSNYVTPQLTNSSNNKINSEKIGEENFTSQQFQHNIYTFNTTEATIIISYHKITFIQQNRCTIK